MVDPILGATLLAGGTLANAIGSGKVSSKRGRILDDEGNRQAEYQRKAQVAFDQILPEFTRDSFDRGIAGAGARRATALRAGIGDAPGPKVPMRSSVPAQVTSEYASTGDRATTLAGQFADSLAKMGAFRDVMFGKGIDLNRTKQEVGRMADFAAGSNRVLPMELVAANNAGSTWRGIADILNQAGGMAFMSSLYGGGAAVPGEIDPKDIIWNGPRQGPGFAAPQGPF